MTWERGTGLDPFGTRWRVCARASSHEAQNDLLCGALSTRALSTRQLHSTPLNLGNTNLRASHGLGLRKLPQQVYRLGKLNGVRKTTALKNRQLVVDYY